MNKDITPENIGYLLTIQTSVEVNNPYFSEDFPDWMETYLDIFNIVIRSKDDIPRIMKCIEECTLHEIQTVKIRPIACTDAFDKALDAADNLLQNAMEELDKEFSEG